MPEEINRILTDQISDYLVHHRALRRRQPSRGGHAGRQDSLRRQRHDRHAARITGNGRRREKSCGSSISRRVATRCARCTGPATSTRRRRGKHDPCRPKHRGSDSRSCFPASAHAGKAVGVRPARTMERSGAVSIDRSARVSRFPCADGQRPACVHRFRRNTGRNHGAGSALPDVP